jgi:NNP family nitrate/nitrite transporter-like MFS transporter
MDRATEARLQPIPFPLTTDNGPLTNTMNVRSFLRAGHPPTLLAAFLYFDMSFMVWVILGALATAIAPDLGLNAAQKGFLVAVPLLGGAFLRVPMGLLTDRIGGRPTGLTGLALTIIPLLLGWLWADGYGSLLFVGLLLGIAGASFAVALPLASRWYPPEHQGLALGIAGAGNSGTALATLIAPRVAERFGWHAAFGFAIVPILITLLVFAWCARDSPRQPAPKPLADYRRLLRRPDTWWCAWFYSITFGGFVGLASFLSILFCDQYGLTRVSAGLFATICVLAGSFLRPVGGYLADRLGGVPVLTAFYVLIAAMMLYIATLPSQALITFALFLTMGLLGMGNGAVFQIVPHRFPKDIGVVTGIVGAAGGLGGFCLPSLLGTVRELTGSFAGGFVLFALAAGISGLLLARVSVAWREGLTAQATPVATTVP